MLAGSWGGFGIATQWFWREQFGTMGPHIPLGAAKSLPTTRWFEVVASPIIGIIAKLDQEQQRNQQRNIYIIYHMKLVYKLGALNRRSDLGDSHRRHLLISTDPIRRSSRAGGGRLGRPPRQ